MQGVEELLAETIETGRRAGVIKAASVNRVIVDTNVMQKAVTFPTDLRLLLEQYREHLVKATARHGQKLRQNCDRDAPHLARQIGGYARVKHSKRMNKVVRTLGPRVGGVMRDVERQTDAMSRQSRGPAEPDLPHEAHPVTKGKGRKQALRTACTRGGESGKRQGAHGL